MSKKKISVLTLVAVLLIIGSIISGIYINTIPRDMGLAVLIGALGFLLGIGGLIVEIKRRNSKGIAICTICLLLYLIFVLAATAAAREKARRFYCASNLKCIKWALQQYAGDNSGYFPPENGAAGLEYLRKNDYMTDYDVYACPNTQTVQGKGSQPLMEENVDYVYIGGLNDKSDPKSPILYDKPGNHEDFGNVVRLDGTAEGISGKNWMEKIRK